MEKVISRDGTSIAFDRSGQGPALIVVGGAFCDRLHPMLTQLAEALSPHFTVFNYDRRGRGQSGDKAPYEVSCEVEDLAAMIAQAGGAAYVLGLSSGGALAIQATASGLPITKLAVYEPPFVIERSHPRSFSLTQYNDLILSGRRSEAIELFLTKAIQTPMETVAHMRTMPIWSTFETLAHTYIYDATIMGDNSLPTEQIASITIPTLVVSGAQSSAWMQKSAQAVANTLPVSQHRVLEGQTHDVAPTALAPVLVEFFASSQDKEKG